MGTSGTLSLLVFSYRSEQFDRLRERFVVFSRHFGYPIVVEGGF